METTFKMENKYITMVRGDTLSFGVEIIDENGDRISQKLDTVILTCKSNKSADENLFQKTLGDGVEERDGGLYAVRVAPEDTANAEPGKYFYDLEIGVNGDIFTIMHGVLEIVQDVTER